MFYIFRKRKGQPKEAVGSESEPAPRSWETTAPGTHIRFDPSLIPGLVADHKTLLALYTGIKHAALQRNAAQVTEKLGEFSDELRGHLLKENVRLYVYLQHSLANDPENAAIMSDLRLEMQQIGKAVGDFIKRYSGPETWRGNVWGQFDADLGNIGKVLVRRIETEERILYPLYMPPDSYA